MIHYNHFDPPIPPEPWVNISSSEESNISFIIKKDGVIYINYHRNKTNNKKITLDLEFLKIKLSVLFTQFITEVYNALSYTNKLEIEIESFGINCCQIKAEGNIDKFFGLREQFDEFNHNYVLDLQDPNNISLKIINDMRKLFES